MKVDHPHGIGGEDRVPAVLLGIHAPSLWNTEIERATGVMLHLGIGESEHRKQKDQQDSMKHGGDDTTKSNQ
jgi:hypothetical protein